jgi:hypothetical protein
MPVTVEAIAQMSRGQVEDLFRGAVAGPIPSGDADGTAVMLPGTPVERPLERVVHRVAWKGKVVDAEHGSLRNKILPFGLRAIAADVYKQASWFDGRECIVLDYSKRSLVAKRVRDEIREVAPGLYLGLVFWGSTKLFYFTLQFEQTN